MSQFWGYVRQDGKVGVRNQVAVIPTVFCANTVAQRIAGQVRGAVAFPHPVGCGYPGPDQALINHILLQLARHPNFGAVLFVGLGCERVRASDLVAELTVTGKPIEVISIQDLGDSLKAVEAGSKIASRFAAELSKQSRTLVGIEHLTMGVKCGGTDATSGIAANPVLGAAADLLVNAGGTVLLTEITELLGTEHIMARRAINAVVAEKINHTVQLNRQILQLMTSNPAYKKWDALISPGNAEGGVSNVVEKALGGLKKAGNASFKDVIEYGASANGHGLYLMDGPGHDGESTTGLACAGAQIIVFTTGRGTPAGFPGVPVVKITGNSGLYQRMNANIDFNAGIVMDKGIPIQEAGRTLFNEIGEVASGALVKAELLGHEELFCISRIVSKAMYCLG
jgi:altronate dehydratase large subunit